MNYDVEPLASHHDRAAFSCAASSLNDYIHRQAGQDMKRDLAACYVLCPRTSPIIIGYYTLTATSVEFTALPLELVKKSGRYPLVPAILLGRLAVDSKFTGQGMSTILLLDALRHTLHTGVGVKLLIVDALNERAAAFYERREFRRFEANPLRLYMPVSKVRDIFPGEGDEADQANAEKRGNP